MVIAENYSRVIERVKDNYYGKYFYTYVPYLRTLNLFGFTFIMMKMQSTNYFTLAR